MALTILNTLTTLTTHYTHHSLHSPHSHLFSFFSRSRNSIWCLTKLVCLQFTSPISALALHSSSTAGPDTTSEGQGEREQQGQGKHRGLVLELSCVNVITSQSTLQAYIMMTYTWWQAVLCPSCRTPRRIAIKGDGYHFDTLACLKWSHLRITRWHSLNRGMLK